MADRATPLAVGVVAVVVGVCCGMPLLLSAGVVATIAGFGLGSWLLGATASRVAARGKRPPRN